MKSIVVWADEPGSIDYRTMVLNAPLLKVYAPALKQFPAINTIPHLEWVVEQVAKIWQVPANRMFMSQTHTHHVCLSQLHCPVTRRCRCPKRATSGMRGSSAKLPIG